MSRRVGYIDIAKAIAIFFIVWGHYGGWEGIGEGLPHTITTMAYTFHVQLFFIASGCFIKLGRPYDLKRDAKSLLLPYVASCVLIIVINAVLTFAGVNDGAVIDSLKTWGLASLYGAGDGIQTKIIDVNFIGGLWFLWALFWGRMFLFAVHKLPCPALWVACLFIAGWQTRELIWLPFSIQSGMCATLYLYIGYLCFQHHLFEDKAIPKPIWGAMLVLWLILIRYGGCYPVSNSYPLGLVDVVGSVAASLCVISFCKQLERRTNRVSRALQFVGRNTLPIFCMHIVDLDCCPIYLIQEPIQAALGIPMGYITLVVHALIITIACLLLYISPKPLSSIFFPRKTRKQTGNPATS